MSGIQTSYPKLAEQLDNLSTVNLVSLVIQQKLVIGMLESQL